MEPVLSLPTSRAVNPAARAAHAPPLEPPTVRSRSQGLLVRPNRGLSVCRPNVRGGRLVLPMMIAPARLNRAATVPSSTGMYPASDGKTEVVRMPAVEWESFSVTGTPWRGPHSIPRARDRSASLALARAPSSSTVTRAFIRLFWEAIRAR